MELTAASWESTVVNSPYIWAVKFFSGMCSSCQAFKPEWEALAHSVNGLCVASAFEPARAGLSVTQLHHMARGRVGGARGGETM